MRWLTPRYATTFWRHNHLSNLVSFYISRTQLQFVEETRFLAIFQYLRNRVSFYISRTKLQIVAEIRFLATRRLKCDRDSRIENRCEIENKSGKYVFTRKFWRLVKREINHFCCIFRQPMVRISLQRRLRVN